jgi:adenylate kinase family enzyme
VKKIIVTGANGTGKSHLAARLASVRPGVPVLSFDAMKLRTGWEQRPRAETEARLIAAIRAESWILEGGPSLLPLAMEQADALVWLDPPEYLRAWRLVLRPLGSWGKTRPELPPGNIDWPGQQYAFAWRSLRNGRQTRATLSATLDTPQDLWIWRCRSSKDQRAVIDLWGGGG